jgi:hypothetical protein
MARTLELLGLNAKSEVNYMVDQDPPTIPYQFLVWTSVYIPKLMVSIVTYLLHSKEEGYRTHITTSPISSTRLIQWYKVSTALAGLLIAISISEASTQLLKLLVQCRQLSAKFEATTKRCLTTNLE